MSTSPRTEKRRSTPEKPSSAFAKRSNGMSSSSPTAMAASAFDTLWRPGHVQTDRARRLILPPYIDAGADSLEDQVLSSDIRLGVEPVGDRSPANPRQEALDHGVVEAECGEPKNGTLLANAQKPSTRLSMLPQCSRCSGSMFVMTATVGSSSMKLPSDSSASATRNSPAPRRAEDPIEVKRPPMTMVGSGPRCGGTSRACSSWWSCRGCRPPRARTSSA